MDYKDLKDSYSKLGVAVEELAAAGQILVIRHKDGNPRVLFCNDEQYNTPIDEGMSILCSSWAKWNLHALTAIFQLEFKKMWTEISIPDETDLPRELENGKLI